MGIFHDVFRSHRRRKLAEQVADGIFIAWQETVAENPAGGVQLPAIDTTHEPTEEDLVQILAVEIAKKKYGLVATRFENGLMLVREEQLRRGVGGDLLNTLEKGFVEHAGQDSLEMTALLRK